MFSVYYVFILVKVLVGQEVRGTANMVLYVLAFDAACPIFRAGALGWIMQSTDTRAYPLIVFRQYVMPQWFRLLVS